MTNMLRSETVGKIIHARYPDDGIWWILPNFFVYNSEKPPESGAFSPWFSFENSTWQLAFMRNDDRSTSWKKYYGLFLWREPSTDWCPNYSVKLGLKSPTGNIGDSFEGKVDVDGCFGKWNFVTVECFSYWAEKISQHGLMKVFCEIQPTKEEKSSNLSVENVKTEEKLANEKKSLEITEDGVAIKNKGSGIPDAKGVDRLLQDLKNLFLDGQNSDTVLKASNREFQVHKAILAARSPVFASMFHHNMAEKTSGVVDIPDCTAESFEAFLQYLYTGRFDAISPDNISNLYYTADKYRVDDLKADCVEFMKKNLSVDTFCDVIALSLRHSESDLMKTATGFFSANLKKIIKTVQWQNFMTENSTYANELLIKALNA